LEKSGEKAVHSEYGAWVSSPWWDLWKRCAWQIFWIGTVRYAEGLWRMRRHGPVIPEDFPCALSLEWKREGVIDSGRGDNDNAEHACWA